MIKKGDKLRFIYPLPHGNWVLGKVYTVANGLEHINDDVFIRFDELGGLWPLWTIEGNKKAIGQKSYWEIYETKPRRNLPDWF